MILRDPVHGLVVFEGRAEAVVTRLLATREVQRLRRVRQLGLTSLVFPGAEHTRFAHALGTAHVMVRLVARIRECEGQLPADQRLTDGDADDAIAAALLHDLGHGPFSHLFEELLPAARHHEAWTQDAILSPTTEVHRALEAHDPGMAARVAALLTGEHRLGYLTRALSGTLDVDRCDYLLRDSRMTGVSYGLFDLDWLLRAHCFGELGSAAGGGFTLAIEGRKGLPAIEGFFLARHFMYEQVYHHKATRAAECLVRAAFARVLELVREGLAPAGTPQALLSAARGDAVSLAAFMELDDAAITHCFSAWSRERDGTLADFARRILVRELPKTIPLPSGDENADLRREVHRRAAEVADRAGLRAELSVWLDECDDVPYPESTTPGPDGIWVVIRHQPIRRLGDISFLLGELRNKRLATHRLVFPGELRGAIDAAIDGVLA